MYKLTADLNLPKAFPLVSLPLPSPLPSSSQHSAAAAISPVTPVALVYANPVAAA